MTKTYTLSQKEMDAIKDYLEGMQLISDKFEAHRLEHMNKKDKGLSELSPIFYSDGIEYLHDGIIQLKGILYE